MKGLSTFGQIMSALIAIIILYLLWRIFGSNIIDNFDVFGNQINNTINGSFNPVFIPIYLKLKKLL